jgi:hypothetical protein
LSVFHVVGVVVGFSIRIPVAGRELVPVERTSQVLSTITPD